MSEEITLEQVQPLVEEAKAKDTFNLMDVLEQKAHAYPEKDVTVFWNGKAAGEVLWIGDEISELKVEKATLEELQKKEKATGSIVGDPQLEDDLEAVCQKIEELEAKQVAALAEAKASALTFHMRGVAPKLFRAIDAKWRAKIKPKTESEEDQQAAYMARNEAVNMDCISSSIISVTNAEGKVDNSVLTPEKVKALHDVLMQSEWQKIKNLSDMLTFGNGYFQQLVEEDADFLPKP